MKFPRWFWLWLLAMFLAAGYFGPEYFWQLLVGAVISFAALYSFTPKFKESI